MTLNGCVFVCAGVGDQLKMPLVALSVAFVTGPDTRLNVSGSPLGSLAALVKVSVVPTEIVSSAIGASVGGRLPAAATASRPPALVTDCPSGFVTLTVRVPIAAFVATLRLTVRFVGLL